MVRERAAAGATEPGQIVATFGRHANVETADGAVVSCTTRAKRGGYVCGDRVRITRIGTDAGVIEALEQRSSLLYRSDDKREKAIAANLTQIVVVLAVAPVPNALLIDRCLVAAETAGTRSLLVLNKIDLEEGRDAARALTSAYRDLGYRCVETGLHTDIADFAALLTGHTSVLIGASGVGKSTLLNRLIPAASARVGAVSHARQSGRHTTTHAALHRMGLSSAVIDSPGMQAFGLHHLRPAELAEAFVEFRAHLGQCRFADCRHLEEPGCAVSQAVRNGEIATRRLESYRQILGSTGKDALIRTSWRR